MAWELGLESALESELALFWLLGIYQVGKMSYLDLPWSTKLGSAIKASNAIEASNARATVNREGCTNSNTSAPVTDESHFTPVEIALRHKIVRESASVNGRISITKHLERQTAVSLQFPWSLAGQTVWESVENGESHTRHDHWCPITYDDRRLGGGRNNEDDLQRSLTHQRWLAYG